jgi:hypothetical protein
MLLRAEDRVSIGVVYARSPHAGQETAVLLGVKLVRRRIVMSEQQSVEVRFTGEKLATHVEGADVYTLYRTPEGLYRVHIDDGEREQAWLESGRSGEGLTEAQLLRVFPEFEAAITQPWRGSSLGRQFPSSGDVGA